MNYYYKVEHDPKVVVEAGQSHLSGLQKKEKTRNSLDLNATPVGNRCGACVMSTAKGFYSIVDSRVALRLTL